MIHMFHVVALREVKPCLLSVLSQQYSVYPIIWAAGRGHADIVKLLLQNGAKVNCSDKMKS